MTGIVKEFPGVRALDGVDLDVRPGEVHCLLGQNGAGKSTLIKVLSGFHQPEDGHDHLGRPGDVVLHARQGDRARRRDDLPGARPGAAPRRDRERLPRPRDLAGPGSPSAGRPTSGARAAGPARPPGDLADPHRRRAVAGVAADRQHGPRALARHPAAGPRRAVRGARPGGGQEPLPGDPRPHRGGRRRRLHLPPPGGDPRDRRPDHGPQGRPHRRHRPGRRGHADRGADPPDDRPLDRVRLPAAPRDRARPRRAGARGAGPQPRRRVRGSRPHRARRRDRRPGRTRRRRSLRDRRDAVRRPPRLDRHGHRRRQAAAARFGDVLGPRRHGPGPGGAQEPGPAARRGRLQEHHGVVDEPVRPARLPRPRRGAAPGRRS